MARHIRERLTCETGQGGAAGPPRRKVRTGTTFDSWLMLETGLPTHGVFEAWDEAFAGMTMKGVDASISFLTQRQYLRLLGIGIDHAYDVSSIPEALALANECLVRQMRGVSGDVSLGSAPA